MNINVTLQYGAIEAEISGEDRDEVQSELLEFIEFLNENEDDLNLNLSPQQPDADVTQDSGPAVDEGSEHPLAPTARQLGVSVEDLDDVIYVDSDLEEDPQLLIDSEDLGENTVEQQRNAMYALLYVWDECYNNGRMPTSKLNELLELGGISSNNLYRARRGEGQGKFDSQGQGPSASVRLTGVGERAAKTMLQDLVSADS